MVQEIEIEIIIMIMIDNILMIMMMMKMMLMLMMVMRMIIIIVIETDIMTEGMMIEIEQGIDIMIEIEIVIDHTEDMMNEIENEEKETILIIIKIWMKM